MRALEINIFEDRQLTTGPALFRKLYEEIEQNHPEIVLTEKQIFELRNQIIEEYKHTGNNTVDILYEYLPGKEYVSFQADVTHEAVSSMGDGIITPIESIDRFIITVDPVYDFYDNTGGDLIRRIDIVRQLG